MVASAEDDDAVRLMVAHRSQELARVQGRAEKWTAGLVALTGAITAALVVKGPENPRSWEQSKSRDGRSEGTTWSSS